MFCNMIYPPSFLPQHVLQQAALHEWQRRHEEEERARALALHRLYEQEQQLLEEEKRRRQRAHLAEEYRQQYILRAFASAAAALQQAREEEEEDLCQQRQRQREEQLRLQHRRHEALARQQRLKRYQQQQHSQRQQLEAQARRQQEAEQRYRLAQSSHQHDDQVQQHSQTELERDLYEMLLAATTDTQTQPAMLTSSTSSLPTSCAMQAVRQSEVPSSSSSSVSAQKQQKEPTEVEKRAAAKIKSVCSDYLSRQKEKKRQLAARTIQSAWRRYVKKRDTARILPSLHAIKSILQDVNAVIDNNKEALLSPLSATFDHDRQKAILPFIDGPNKAVLTAEEKLTTLLLGLDAVETCDGDMTVRTKRKYVVARIEEYLRVIEQKKQLALDQLNKMEHPIKERTVDTTESHSSQQKQPQQHQQHHVEDDELPRYIDDALTMEEQYLKKAVRHLKWRRRQSKTKKSTKFGKQLLF